MQGSQILYSVRLHFKVLFSYNAQQQNSCMKSVFTLAFDDDN
jgi:hypothetical protein